MTKIDELAIGSRVRVRLGDELKEGIVVGRRIRNSVEGYVAPRDLLYPLPQDGADLVQISFPFRVDLREWQTTGLTCPPERVDLVE